MREETMMICPLCQLSPPSDETNFCANDGARLFTLKCDCGEQLAGPDRYCPNCGDFVQDKIAEARAEAIKLRSV